MSMLFFEVFDQLTNLPANLEDVFKDVQVERVSVSKSKSEIRIYMESNRFIKRNHIKKMEYQLQKQLFSSTSNIVVLHESYNLSAQYTPENLFNVYKDSIMEEVRERSILEYNIFELSELRFEDNNMIFRCEDNFLVKKVSGDIITYLTTLYQERFHIDVHVRFEYYEPVKEEETDENPYEYVKIPNQNRKHPHNEDFRKQDQIQADDAAADSYAKELMAIEGGMKDEFAVSKENSNANETKDTIASKKQSSKPDFQNKNTYDKNKFNYKKASNDPDIIYGSFDAFL